MLCLKALRIVKLAMSHSKYGLYLQKKTNFENHWLSCLNGLSLQTCFNCESVTGWAPDVNQQTEATTTKLVPRPQKRKQKHRNNNNNATGNSCMRHLRQVLNTVYTPVMHHAFLSRQPRCYSRSTDRKWLAMTSLTRAFTRLVHCCARDTDRCLSAT